VRVPKHRPETLGVKKLNKKKRDVWKYAGGGCRFFYERGKGQTVYWQTDGKVTIPTEKDCENGLSQMKEGRPEKPVRGGEKAGSIGGRGDHRAVWSARHEKF